MKPKKHIADSIGQGRALLLLGMLAALLVAAACSSDSTPAVKAAESAGTALQTVVPADQQPAPVAVKTSSPMPQSKLLAYRSRDYGVSFLYPWQYAYFNAKAIANDESLRPLSGGHDGQFTLVRIEILKGFYPDTNFETGYFTLTLNQDLDEQQCQPAPAGAEEKAQTENINGVDFRWAETDSGGNGSAAKVRNYVAFNNGTCYLVEMGVKTRNQQGLAREVDPDQVLRRLETMLRTVKIQPTPQNAVAAHVEPSAPAPIEP